MYYQQQAKSQHSCRDLKSSDQIRENTQKFYNFFYKKKKKNYCYCYGQSAYSLGILSGGHPRSSKIILAVDNFSGREREKERERETFRRGSGM